MVRLYRLAYGLRMRKMYDCSVPAGGQPFFFFAVIQKRDPVGDRNCVSSRTEWKHSAGFVGIFIPVYKGEKFGRTLASSHFHEVFVPRLSRSAQNIQQVLRSTLR